MAISNEHVLRISSDDEEAIHTYLGKSREEVGDIFDELIEWKSSQPHLPNDNETMHLSCMLRLNKYNIEKTKWKLDNYYTYRNTTPELYENRNPLHPEIRSNLENMMFLPLPKLHNNTTRVSIVKLLNEDPALFNHESFFKVVFAVGDLRLHYDKAIFDVYIFDFTECQLRHILKIKPTLIKKGIEVVRNVFCERIKGIHLVNTPTYAYAIIKLTKSFLPRKIGERIYFHDNFDSIREFIDLDILPEEFGGSERPIIELYDMWRLFLIEKDEWLQKESMKKTIEQLRNKESESIMTRLMNTFK